MTNWYRYWKRKGHTPKALCDWYPCLDSFKIFKIKNFSGLTVTDKNFTATATYDNDSLQISLTDLKYRVLVDKQLCQFGGYRYFWRCPGIGCNRRMRKLYCYRGIFVCRKCLKLGYYSQRVTASTRCSLMQKKIEDALKNVGGSLWQRPKSMHRDTYEKIKARHWDYEWKCETAMAEECYKRFGEYP